MLASSTKSGVAEAICKPDEIKDAEQQK